MSSLLAKSLSRSFSYFLLQSKHLNTTELSLTVRYSRSYLQFLRLSLWNSSVRLLARLDSELDINLTQWMNFVLYVTALLFSFFFNWHQKSYVFLRVSPFTVNYFCCMLPQISTKILHRVLTPVETMFAFVVVKWTVCE